jgi:arsenate reductase (glutaredoxin)
LLKENGIVHTYREYTKEPFSRVELEGILSMLGVGPRDVLRARDAKKAGLTGDESDAELLDLMTENPRLVQRPIGILGQKAIIGRPPELLLNIV